ncbi:DNA-directed RNA polymerase subunit beta [Vagococcus acidifermentans]|uniref:DNA-directed RNA polymerase subunit beta n=1 Tax=Vagococcus acidifermentans TaxID=564710 RepID=A0A430ATZ2_9ENTE|nr:DNA-directed RNA polymerase subunit beta [Vagococcus acidifermentans]RSU11516.1 DNA-directed RNA polymerase subunit beta [Vagococcus acidifermentans]
MDGTGRRVLFQLLKILLVVLGLIVLFLIGTMVGYGVIGKGDMFEVFQKETWQHIFDFMR